CGLGRARRRRAGHLQGRQVRGRGRALPPRPLGPRRHRVGGLMRRRSVTLTPAFQRLMAAGPVTREAIDTFLGAHAFPLVEGTHVTWVYRGEAKTIGLRHWVYGLPSSQPMARLAGTDLWLVTL